MPAGGSHPCGVMCKHGWCPADVTNTTTAAAAAPANVTAATAMAAAAAAAVHRHEANEAFMSLCHLTFSPCQQSAHSAEAAVVAAWGASPARSACATSAVRVEGWARRWGLASGLKHRLRTSSSACTHSACMRGKGCSAWVL